MKTHCYVYLFLLFFTACQSAEVVETVEPAPTDDTCWDKFEPVNNQRATAPMLLSSGQWAGLFLSKNDQDYWRISVKANEKGKIPTKISYHIGSMSTIEITTLHQDTIVANPKTTMTFRNDTYETIDIGKRQIGDTLTVHIRHKAGTATCYTLQLQ